MTDHGRISTPAESFPPGEFLQDALDNLGWTQGEFAELIGRPTRLINEIVAGKRAITPTTASEIAAALGTSAQYWLNLESAYQLTKAPVVDERISREAALRQRFPVREMAKRAWIVKTKDLAQLEQSVLGFFRIPSVDAPVAFSHAARRNYNEDLSMVQLVWLYRVRQLATGLQIPKYSEEKLRKAVSEDLDRLTTEPEEIRHVPKILAECGVRFVVVEPIPGSKIDGVCFWMDDNKTPVIGLSMKGDQIDKFWFNLRHEIEHVLRGDGKDVACIDEFDGSQSEDECEVAANAAAEEFCVPVAKMRSFMARHAPAISEAALLGFARVIKRHPGIVAGQVQKRLGRWDLFKKHQPRVRTILIQTALTDGYGQTVPIEGEPE